MEAKGVCDGCWLWEEFKEKCHFYWEDKRICTQFKDGPHEPPKYKMRDENEKRNNN